MKNFLLLVVVLIFSGCGSVSVKNKIDAKLMPEPIAKQVLAKYFGEAWVANPRGRFMGGYDGSCEDNGYGKLPFNEINVLRSFQNGTIIIVEKTNWIKAVIPCSLMSHQISGNFSTQDIDDIANALVSLGANIDVKK